MDQTLLAVIAAACTAFGALAAKIVDYLTAKRLGLGALNVALNNTLHSTVEAQAAQIATQARHVGQLTTELQMERVARTALEHKVSELRDTVSSQAIELAQLRLRRYRAPIKETTLS